MNTRAPDHKPPGGPAHCRVCGAALGGLRARLRDICERPACLQQETLEQRREERRLHEAALRRALPSQALADRHPPAVVWLRSHAVEVVDLPQDLRDDQVQHLLALAKSAGDGQAAEPDPPGAGPARAEVQICTWCQGRCCRFGRGHHAFIDAGHLRRWQLGHAGSTLDEAASAYVALLPERHAEGSCAYHGERGCTLPREMRSAVCNRHVCEALDEVQSLCRKDPERELVLAMGRREVEAAAWADAAGLHPVQPRYE